MSSAPAFEGWMRDPAFKAAFDTAVVQRTAALLDEQLHSRFIKPKSISGAKLRAGVAGYSLYAAHASTNPSDAASGFFGAFPSAAAQTTWGSRTIVVPKSGTITEACFKWLGGVAGTAESFSLYVRMNDATDYLVDTEAVAAAERTFNGFGLDIPVSAGDELEMKFVYPTWATNPTGVFVSGHVYVAT